MNKIWTSRRHEINICAEFLDQGIYEVVSTLLHEMVHHYNNMKGIDDCSRGGNYHNKKFRDEAVKRGLKVTYDTKYGYSFTELDNKSKEIIDDLNYKDIFKIKRQDRYKNKGNEKKSNSLKYVCPFCDTIIRATKEVDVLCGRCSTEKKLVRMKIKNVKIYSASA